MKRILFLILLLGCSNTKTETVYVQPDGNVSYACDDRQCISVQINNHDYSCVDDSGAYGTVWISLQTASDLDLTPYYSESVLNSFGTGMVDVYYYDNVVVCDISKCQEITVYGIDMRWGCLYGL